MPGSEMAQSPVDVAERFGQALKIGKDQGSEVAVDVLGTPLKEQVDIPGPLFIPDQGAWPFLFPSGLSPFVGFPGGIDILVGGSDQRPVSLKLAADLGDAAAIRLARHGVATFVEDECRCP
jgi:hypothetical protein